MPEKELGFTESLAYTAYLELFMLRFMARDMINRIEILNDHLAKVSEIMFEAFPDNEEGRREAERSKREVDLRIRELEYFASPESFDLNEAMKTIFNILSNDAEEAIKVAQLEALLRESRPRRENWAGLLSSMLH